MRRSSHRSRLDHGAFARLSVGVDAWLPPTLVGRAGMAAAIHGARLVGGVFGSHARVRDHAVGEVLGHAYEDARRRRTRDWSNAVPLGPDQAEALCIQGLHRPRQQPFRMPVPGLQVHGDGTTGLSSNRIGGRSSKVQVGLGLSSSSALSARPGWTLILWIRPLGPAPSSADARLTLAPSLEWASFCVHPQLCIAR